MLEIALDGAIKTKIMYKAFLSFPQLKEYLTVLEEKGLLEFISTDHQYRTTDKGTLVPMTLDESEEIESLCNKAEAEIADLSQAEKKK